MGELEACMLSCVIALQEKEPILISDHIVKNVYEALKDRGARARVNALKTLLDSIPPDVRDQNLQIEGSEIARAAGMLSGQYSPHFAALVNLKREVRSCSVLFEQCALFKTKIGSLHMLLILPQQKASKKDLEEQGFVADAFERVPSRSVSKYIENLHNSSNDVLSMSRPLEINELRGLFVTDSSLGRNIFLFGHGSVGCIAYLSSEKFGQLINMLNGVGCASLSVFSCHAGCAANLEVHRVPSNFLKIIFSVGDLVARAFGYGDKGYKNCLYSKFFLKLREYLQQSDGASPSALRVLFEAVAYIHGGMFHNYPWFCFPNTSEVKHLSVLVDELRRSAYQSTDELSAVEVPCVVPACATGLDIDKHMGVITKEGYADASAKGEGFVFDSKRTLLLHVQCVNVPIKFLNSVPVVLSMIDVPFHCLDNLDMSRLFLSTLLERFVLLRKVCVIKNLLCMNYSGSNIAHNRGGQLLCIKDCIIEPVQDTWLGQTRLLRALFRLAEGPYYTLECFFENECLKNIVRRDGTQASLKEEHMRSILQFFGMHENSPFAQQILDFIESQRRSSDTVSTGLQGGVHPCTYIDRTGDGEALTKRQHRL
jgi:hypothetical protein